MKRLKKLDQKALKEFEKRLLIFLNLRPKLFVEFKKVKQEVENMPVSLRELPIYKEGLIEGKKKGKKEGKKEGMIKAYQNMIIKTLSLRFSSMDQDIEKKVKSIKSLKKLEQLIEKSLTATNIEEIKVLINQPKES